MRQSRNWRGAPVTSLLIRRLPECGMRFPPLLDMRIRVCIVHICWLLRPHAYSACRTQASTNSAYGMAAQARFCGAICADRPRQKTCRLPQTAAGRAVICCVRQEDGIAPVHALSIGAMSAEPHCGAAERIDEEAEGDAGGHFREVAVGRWRIWKFLHLASLTGIVPAWNSILKASTPTAPTPSSHRW